MKLRQLHLTSILLERLTVKLNSIEIIKQSLFPAL